MIKVNGCVISLSSGGDSVNRVIRECFVRHIFVNRGRPCDQNVLCDRIFAPPLLEAASAGEKDVRRVHFLTLAIKKEEEGEFWHGGDLSKVDLKLWRQGESFQLSLALCEVLVSREQRYREEEKH